MNCKNDKKIRYLITDFENSFLYVPIEYPYQSKAYPEKTFLSVPLPFKLQDYFLLAIW